jgi:glucose-6-phosphate 1-epimerase
MNLAQLNEHFALPGVLAFHEIPTGLVYAVVTTAQAKATVYLQGAHLTEWQPTGHQPVIFTSRKSEFDTGKPIRGGVPVIFPWFGPRHDGKTGPSHGFARTQDWTLAFAALAGEDLHLTFTLGPTDISRELGFDHFRVAYQMTIGRTLTLQITVGNDATAPLLFEEALHSYYAVADVHEVTISGLEGTAYLDKNDKLQSKSSPTVVTMDGPTDRVYLNTAATCVIRDVAGRRRITIAKKNSNTTVVWNPWEAAAQKLADLEPNEWHEFVCVETANAAVNSITLAPGATHTMEAHVSVEEPKVI